MNASGFDWPNKNNSFDSSDSYNNSNSRAPHMPTPSISFQQASTSNGFIPAPPPVPPRQHTSSAHLFPEQPTSLPYRNNGSVDDINSRHASASAIIHGSYGDSYDSVLDRRSRHDSIMNQSMSVNESLVSDDQDSYIPLSLTAQDLTLQESKTYMRWYSDILARTSSRTITMNDVYTFLNNFKISQEIKEKVNRIFSKIFYSINIGEFFALLRVISHTLQGKEPSRQLITIKAPVPTPPSILSKKRQNDDDYEDGNESISNEEGSELNSNGSVQDVNKPLDIDSFTQFLLTGERPDEQPKKRKSKKLKSVKFSDQVDIHDDSFVNSPSESPQPQDIDYSLPMDQLLNRIKSQPRVPQQQQQSSQLPTLSQLQQQQKQQEEEEEREILKDMESQINHFQNLHSVDTVSIGGVPSSIHLQNSSENLLRPNMTGPAQMARMFSPSPDPELLQPNMTGPTQMAQYLNRTQNNVSPLMPNVTGPADMARIFAPSNNNNSESQHIEAPKISLQSFTSQMTGNTMENTLQNSQLGQDNNLLSRPPPVPFRNRSSSSPTPSSGNIRSDAFPPPVPPRSPLSRVPPPPPPSRRRNSSMVASASIPPPLPPKVPQSGLGMYQSGGNDSTSNILDDLKALQEEVDKIRDMTGGF
ncbi:Protein SCD5 [Spathaspora sp. JA1]|nr:Protein SCD5 [Spathaspora sp. JA1]